MDHQSRNNSGDPRNSEAARPDAGLRWAGRVLFVTTGLLITDLALQPGLPTPPELFGPDKIEHFLAFFVLTMLARMGWPRRGWITAIMLLSYGIGIELVQGATIFGRTASAADVAADLIGIGLGLVFANLFRQRVPA
ncbi:VanZ family protein [Maricaulis sp.]|uniref:VanZ family protein n=1 Tax=Maricaulis sp. TaxID=1486257 RepID=UPI003A900E2F